MISIQPSMTVRIVAILFVIASGSIMAQNPSAYVKLNGNPMNETWPNDGTINVLAFGWSGERPQPVRVLADSNALYWMPGGTPSLNVQMSADLFSELLRDAVEQQITLPAVTFTVNTIRHGAVTYTLYDVRLISIRDIGKVFDESPTTEELVLSFRQIEQDQR